MGAASSRRGFPIRMVLFCLFVTTPLRGAPDEDGDHAACLRVGAERMAQGDFRQADAAYRRGFETAEASGLPTEAKLSALRGRIDALSAVSDYVVLRDVSRQILEVQEAAGDSEGAAYTQLDIGYLETVLGNAREAVAILRQAVRHYEALGDLDRRAQAVVRLANACLCVRQLGQALAYALDAERRFREMKDEDSLLETLSLLAIIHLQTGDDAAARDAIKRRGRWSRHRTTSPTSTCATRRSANGPATWMRRSG